MDYEIKYVMRPIGNIQNYEYLHNGDSNVEIEFILSDKNNWLVKIKTIKDESKNKYNPYKNLIIDNIITNTKAIKKLKLPFRKSKVEGGTHKDSEYIKDYNRYAFQLKLGTQEVKKIMLYILETWKKEQGFVPNNIIGYRITGISGNSGGRKRMIIKNKSL